MSDQNQEEYYDGEETFDEYADYPAEGDYDDYAWATQVEEIVETYESVFQSAFSTFASINNVGVEDFDELSCTLSAEQAVKFVHHLGLSEHAASIITDSSSEVFTKDELYQLLETSGQLEEASLKDAKIFKNLISVLSIVQLFTTSGPFVSQEHRIEGETRLVFGPVEGEGKAFCHFSMNKHLDETQQSLFNQHPDAFFACSCDIELVSKEALEFVKECFVLTVDVMAVFTRQIGGGLQVQFTELPGKENLLRITLLGNNFYEPLQGNILYALEFAHQLLPEFNSSFAWDYNLLDVLDKPIAELTHVEISTSLPRLGIAPEFITLFCQKLEETVENFLPGENVITTIKNFEEFKNGQTNVTLDFTETARQLIQKGEGIFDPSSTLITLIEQFAPMGAQLVMGVLETDPSLQPGDIIKAISSLFELIKKLIGRDFVDCTSVSVRTKQGYGFTQRSHNFLNIDILFSFLQRILTAVSSAVQSQP